MESNLLKYIWRHSSKEQIWMLIVILASMPTYFLSLELPKRIVNGPIQGVGFEEPGAVGNFLQTYVPLPEWLTGGPIEIFGGFELERIPFLMALSITFLALVVANGLFKLYINTYKGRMGERILRRLRFELFDRVLRYPLPRFKRTKASEVATMIKDEVEPMGEFIGDAYTMPLFYGGQALTGLAFIFLQNVNLGIATIIIVGFQAWLIPLLRRRLIQLNKQRQIAARKLAGRLGEIVDGIQDAHMNDTTNLERTDISSTLGRLFFIRFELFQRKFSVKFLNNLLIQFLAFVFYAGGGYFAITGRLDIGQLVAVIAAYKDLPGPIRGLIDYDQRKLTVETRFQQVTEQFAADELQPSENVQIADGPVPHITSGFELSNVGVVDEAGSKLIERASTSIATGERVALVGRVNSGASDLAEVLARIVKPTSGRISVDGTQLHDLPEHMTGRRVAYIDGHTFFPQCSIFDALVYVLKNQPITMIEREASAEAVHQRELAEARRAGNYELDIKAQWVDYERAGVADQEELIEYLREILIDVQLEEDVRGFGLRGTLDPIENGELCDQIIIARKRFKSRLADLGFEGFVEPFESESFNTQATIAENLLFGTAVDRDFEPNRLPSNTVIREILAECDLEDDLFAMGKEVASTTIELFGDLALDNPFFDQLNYMDAEDLPEYRIVLARISDNSFKDISESDRQMIMKLPFSYVEDKNRLGLLTSSLMERIVIARKKLIEQLEGDEDPKIAFYDTESYNSASSVLDNVLLGRVASTVAEGSERVEQSIRDLLDEMELTDDIFRIGLQYNMGTGGKRLSENQRQKLHLARSLAKRPDFLIVNQAMNTLDARGQRLMVERVLSRANSSGDHKMGVIWVPMNPATAELFDRVIMFENGELIADDTHEALLTNEEKYRELLEG